MVPARRSLPWTRRLLGWLARRLQIISQPVEVITTPDWDQDHPVQQAYAPVASMSAFGEFPWVVAAVRAVATDIAGLPIKVQRGEGERQRTMQRHDALTALRRPAANEGPTAWRRQLVVDLLLSGNAYVLMVGAPGSGRLVALVRLHPEEVEIITGEGGVVRGFAYGVGGDRPVYDVADVVHIKLDSWRSGPQSVYGQGIVEVLKTELSGEHAAAQRWKEEAGRGRAGMVVSPKDDAGQIKPDVMVKALVRIQDQLAKYGAAGVSNAVDLKLLPFSARDMEFGDARRWTREAVLAVVGVASTRGFLPDANFATAQQQMRTYWQNLLGIIALFEDGFAKIAERAGRLGDRICHDISGVEALQESRTARLERAVLLKETFGLSPLEALRIEGFADIDESMLADTQPDAQPDDEGGDVIPFPGSDDATDEQKGGPAMVAKDAGAAGKHTVIFKLMETPEVEVGQAPRFRFVASTDSEDRHGDIVRQNWKLAAYRQNPVILWNHDSSRPPIARALSVEVVDGRLEIDMEFDVEDDFAMQVAGKIDRGFINAGSVGFISGEMGWRADLDKDDPDYARGYGMVLDENELMEFSITPVQSNRDATAERKSAFEKRSRPDKPRPAEGLTILNLTTDTPGDELSILTE